MRHGLLVLAILLLPLLALPGATARPTLLRIEPPLLEQGGWGGCYPGPCEFTHEIDGYEGRVVMAAQAHQPDSGGYGFAFLEARGTLPASGSRSLIVDVRLDVQAATVARHDNGTARAYVEMDVLVWHDGCWSCYRQLYTTIVAAADGDCYGCLAAAPDAMNGVHTVSFVVHNTANVPVPAGPVAIDLSFAARADVFGGELGPGQSALASMSADIRVLDVSFREPRGKQPAPFSIQALAPFDSMVVDDCTPSACQAATADPSTGRAVTHVLAGPGGLQTDRAAVRLRHAVELPVAADFVNVTVELLVDAWAEAQGMMAPASAWSLAHVTTDAGGNLGRGLATAGLPPCCWPAGPPSRDETMRLGFQIASWSGEPLAAGPITFTLTLRTQARLETTDVAPGAAGLARAEAAFDVRVLGIHLDIQPATATR